MAPPIDAFDLALRGLGQPRGALLVATLGRIEGGDYGMTVFNDRLDTEQGRIEPDGATPPSGTHAVVLGSDREGVYGRLALGDLVQIAQEVDVTDDEVLRATLILRTPDDVPAGFAWKAALYLDDEERVSTLGWPGKTRTISDFGIPVTHLAGVRVFGIRLQLVEAA